MTRRLISGEQSTGVGRSITHRDTLFIGKVRLSLSVPQYAATRSAHGFTSLASKTMARTESVAGKVMMTEGQFEQTRRDRNRSIITE
jgi:hypothetical protein